MLKTTASLASADYVLCVRRGRIPEGVAVRIRHPRLIIAMPLHAPGERRARFPARPDAEPADLGGIFLIPPDHELCVAGGAPQAWSFSCVLAPARFDRLLNGRSALTGGELTRALDLRSAAISFCMRRLMKETVCPRPESRALADALVSVLLIELSRELFDVDPVADEPRSALSDERLQKIMDYIEAFPIGVPSVEDLAAQCGLSAQYFSRQFRERAGQSIGRFIAVSRLRRAERLLVETTLPLKEIAFRLGFANSATFSTAFRNEMRVPPGAYREQALASFTAIENRTQPDLGPSARLEIERPRRGQEDRPVRRAAATMQSPAQRRAGGRLGVRAG
jgi:AraC family transcriptional regulator